MRNVSYGVRCCVQRTRTDDKRRGRRIVSSTINKPWLLTFTPAFVRLPFAAVAETATDIRRSLLPLIFPLGQSATRPSSRRNVDQSGRGPLTSGGRYAPPPAGRGPRGAPFRQKNGALPFRSLPSTAWGSVAHTPLC